MRFNRTYVVYTIDPKDPYLREQVYSTDHTILDHGDGGGTLPNGVERYQLMEKQIDPEALRQYPGVRVKGSFLPHRMVYARPIVTAVNAQIELSWQQARPGYDPEKLGEC